MQNEGNHIQDQSAKTRKASGKAEKMLQNVLGGTFLTREKALHMLPFLFFLAFIAIVYIGNIYVAERKIRKIKEINVELKELRYEYISTKSELMFLSKQSQLARKLAGSGIKESRIPPEKIYTSRKDK